MRTCPHCSGQLLRHSRTHTKTGEFLRYRCKECGKTFQMPIAEDKITGFLPSAPKGGRAFLRDWRFNGLGVSDPRSAAA